MGAFILTFAAFLLGSFPTGVLVVQVVSGQDVRQIGSGNIGAANAARTAGLGVGVAVALLDMLKGALPILIGIGLGLDHTACALVGAAAVLGHDFSPFLWFRGGKGVATTLGVLLVLAPLATAVALAVWIATMLTWRYSSLASLVALILLPIALTLTGQPRPYVFLTVGLCLLSLFKHWDNILRLWQGTEHKFHSPRPVNGG
ncbi:MAG: glycerol-3-phosphate 1-O-acyltransferase PlsY [Chloroflexota bacterium]